MTDDVKFSIRQIDGAWRLMCAGGPKPVVAATEGIQYIFSGVPISFFNLAVLTGSGLSAEALGTHAREACAWAAAQSVPCCWWSPTSSTTKAVTGWARSPSTSSPAVVCRFPPRDGSERSCERLAQVASLMPTGHCPAPGARRFNSSSQPRGAPATSRLYDVSVSV
jgi:hypothetical protein